MSSAPPEAGDGLVLLAYPHAHRGARCARPAHRDGAAEMRRRRRGAALLGQRMAARGHRQRRGDDVPGVDRRGALDAVARRAVQRAAVGRRPARLRAPRRRPGRWRSRSKPARAVWENKLPGRADVGPSAGRPPVRRLRATSSSTAWLPTRARRSGAGGRAAPSSEPPASTTTVGLLPLARQRAARARPRTTAPAVEGRRCPYQPTGGPVPLGAPAARARACLPDVAAFSAVDGKAAGSAKLAGEPAAPPRYPRAPTLGRPAGCSS